MNLPRDIGYGLGGTEVGTDKRRRRPRAVSPGTFLTSTDFGRKLRRLTGHDPTSYPDQIGCPCYSKSDVAPTAEHRPIDCSTVIDFSKRLEPPFARSQKRRSRLILASTDGVSCVLRIAAST
jgi:hypothetical protein